MDSVAGEKSPRLGMDRLVLISSDVSSLCFRLKIDLIMSHLYYPSYASGCTKKRPSIIKHEVGANLYQKEQFMVGEQDVCA